MKFDLKIPFFNEPDPFFFINVNTEDIRYRASMHFTYLKNKFGMNLNFFRTDKELATIAKIFDAKTNKFLYPDKYIAEEPIRTEFAPGNNILCQKYKVIGLDKSYIFYFYREYKGEVNRLVLIATDSADKYGRIINANT